jgi:hypothetical protein
MIWPREARRRSVILRPWKPGERLRHSIELVIAGVVSVFLYWLYGTYLWSLTSALSR